MTLSKKRIAILALIAANIIWGASFPVYKWALENVPPYTFVFLRFFLASLLILPFTLHHLTIRRKDIFRLIILSVFGVTLPISFLFLGLELSSSINAPIIMSSGPILLIIYAIFFLHERTKGKVIFGTIISLMGVMVLIMQPLIEQGFNGSMLGNIFFLLATIGSIFHTLMLKKMMETYRLLTLTFWYFVISSIPLLPFVYTESQTSGFLGTLNLQGLLGISFGVVFASAIGHVIYNYGIKRVKANEIGIFAYIDPVAAIVVAIPLLGEKITLSFIFAAVLVFGGIFIAEGRLHYHPFHRLRKKYLQLYE
jgi:drug/metabolite transporter (DMT)-like permease